jgi:hypothetical protein
MATGEESEVFVCRRDYITDGTAWIIGLGVRVQSGYDCGSLCGRTVGRRDTMPMGTLLQSSVLRLDSSWAAILLPFLPQIHP